MNRTALRIAGGAAIAIMLMGMSCPSTVDIDDPCYPQVADQWGNCPEPGRDYGDAPSAEPAEAPEPARSPDPAPSPEPNEPEPHDYDQKET